MKREAVEILADGSERLAKTPAGRREYRRRVEEMWTRQDGLCALCEMPMRMDEATFEHALGKGMGNSHGDDRIERNGEWFNAAAHGFCNGVKQSKRYHWQEINGIKRYVPKEKA